MASSAHGEEVAVVLAPGGNRYRAAPGQVVTRYGPGLGTQFVERAGDDDLAAALPRPWSDVDDPVGSADGLFVVFDDENRVSEIPQVEERVQETLVVSLVQANGGLVQDVEHAHQPGADLRGQSDPLRLSPGEGGGGPAQSEIVQAHVQ
jgi:hypothetical protein